MNREAHTLTRQTLWAFASLFAGLAVVESAAILYVFEHLPFENNQFLWSWSVFWICAAWALGMLSGGLFATLSKVFGSCTMRRARFHGAGLGLFLGLYFFLLVEPQLSHGKFWLRPQGFAIWAGECVLVVISVWSFPFLLRFLFNSKQLTWKRFTLISLGAGLGLLALLPTQCIVFALPNPGPAIDYFVDGTPSDENTFLETQAQTVILISVDTLRADHTTLLGYYRDTTPHLATFFEEGAIFLEAYTPKTHTAPAMATVHTGLTPPLHQVYSYSQPLAQSLTTMAEWFSTHGYETHGIVSNLVLYLPRNQFNQGFDHFQGYPLGSDSAETLVQQVLPLLEKDEKPQFIWLHLFDPHAPYVPPDEYLELYYPEDSQKRFDLPDKDLRVLLGETYDSVSNERLQDPEYFKALYDAEIRYLDNALWPLLDALKERPETVVAFMADHGENMNEHANPFDHGRDCYDSNAHVPLAFWKQGVEFQETRPDSMVSLADVFPTLCELAEIPVPNGLEGRGLLSSMNGEYKENEEPLQFIYGEYQPGRQHYAVRSRTHKYILMNRRIRYFTEALDFRTSFFYDIGPNSMYSLYRFRTFREEFYDMKRDVWERNNLAEENPKEMPPLKKALWDHLEMASRSVYVQEKDTERFSDSERETLKSLGYIQ